MDFLHLTSYFINMKGIMKVVLHKAEIKACEQLNMLFQVI